MIFGIIRGKYNQAVAYLTNLLYTFLFNKITGIFYSNILKLTESREMRRVCNSSAADNTVLSEHCQVCDEISFILSGEGYFFSNGKKYYVHKGDCIFSFKNELHNIENIKDKPLRFYFCGFSAKNENTLHIVNNIKSQPLPYIRCEAAESIFSKMINESWTEELYVSDMLNSQLLQLLITVSRTFSLNRHEKKRPPYSSLVYQIMLYLDSHINEPDALSQLESEFNYNYRFLYQSFYECMGDTLREYFLKIRMKKAALLLKDGLTVTEISEILGYSSVHPFSRAFKKLYGLSPSKYNKTDTDI